MLFGTKEAHRLIHSKSECMERQRRQDYCVGGGHCGMIHTDYESARSTFKKPLVQKRYIYHAYQYRLQTKGGEVNEVCMVRRLA